MQFICVDQTYTIERLVMRVHAYAIMFTCIGKGRTIAGNVSGQFPYHDATCGSTLESQM